MKKKRVTILGLVFVMFGNFVACGASEPQDKTVEEEITIAFATNVVGKKAEVLEAVCKDFEKETGYQIDFQAPGSSYEELMKTKMSVRELPDVFTTHGWSVTRYKDYLMPVNELEWADDIDAQIKPVVTDEEGKIYVLPVDMDIAGIIYNENVLKNAGVFAEEIRTWDDFTQACEKIKASGKNPIHIGGKDIWTIGQYFDWVAPSYYITDEGGCRAADLKNGKFDMGTWEKVAGLLDSWVKEGYINEDVFLADYNSDVKAIAEGDTAFCFYGNSFAVDVKGVNSNAKIGMMPIPATGEENAPSLIAGEDIAVGVWKDSEVKDEAVEFLNYLARPEVSKKLAEAAGNKAGLMTVEAEMGELGRYLDRYAEVPTYPYFDREYLPSGMWDVMCVTGADILAQKDDAVYNAAKIMEQNFNDKFVK